MAAARATAAHGGRTGLWNAGQGWDGAELGRGGRRGGHSQRLEARSLPRHAVPAGPLPGHIPSPGEGESFRSGPFWPDSAAPCRQRVGFHGWAPRPRRRGTGGLHWWGSPRPFLGPGEGRRRQRQQPRPRGRSTFTLPKCFPVGAESGPQATHTPGLRSARGTARAVDRCGC